ncbi:MAG: aminopeptidase [Candidatus Krumholzibacteria bacterium]|nr:aminopeptidase [Candidatus Krumholzibacteria bacterium]
MISDRRMTRAANTALSQCLGVREGEKLLIVANPEYRRIGEALYAEGVKLGAQAALLYYPKAGINGEEPPALIAGAMVKSDVVVAPTVASLTHTSARRRACKAGARVATMPGITEEFFVRGLSADYDDLMGLTKEIHRYLDAAKVAHVTSPSGCDLVLDVRNPAIVSDGNLKMRGSFSNLPTGETELAPKNAKGILVVDRCAQYVDEPTVFEIDKGHIVKYDGNPSGRRLKRLIEGAKVKDGNDNASFVAEFAIGTNKKAKITGTILEDEKVFGTCHVAFGDNTSYPGGKNPSVLHMDVIVCKPTIALDGRTIMKNGKLTT